MSDEELSFEEAIEASESLLKNIESPEDEERPDAPSGGKRHPGRYTHSIIPLPGVKNIETAGRIREIVGLRFAGFSDSKIERQIKVGKKYIWELEKRYPEAFETARADQIKAILRDYGDGLVVVAGAIGKLGPRAMRTLGKELINYKSGTAHTRLKAVELIVKMLAGAAMIPRSTKDSVDEIASAVVDQIRDVADSIGRDRVTYVIDSEAEVIDEDAS